MPEPRVMPVTASDRPWRTWTWAIAIGLGACAFFAFRLEAEPHFVDESAYYSQTYFLDLLVRPNHPLWLEYPAVDLPPLPKYLMAVSLRTCGERLGKPSEMRLWYLDTRRRFASPTALVAARLPSVVLGAVGCVAIYAIGTMLGDRRVGIAAAVLLAINPLYRLLARRAMADVPAECFILCTCALGLWAWRLSLSGRMSLRLSPVFAAGIGIFGGLAVLAKLNGGLGLMVVAAWAVLAAALGASVRYAGAFAAGALAAFGLFVALNPYLTAHPPVPLRGPFASLAREAIWAIPIAERREPAPSAVTRESRYAALAHEGLWDRTRDVVDHRVGVSRDARAQFSHNALSSWAEKGKAVVTQGFGRFGPFGPGHSDSTRRFQWAQDRGAVIWLPWVTLGALWALARGYRQWNAQQPPVAWAILLQAAIAAVTVTAFIPLAWDRYFLSIQPGSALLAAGVAVAAFDRLSGWVLRRPGARGGA